jgi:branched-chain amino acid transport system substrate-binding protein
MKMEALTNFMKNDKKIKKVFIIGQDYAHGHQVAKYAKEMLAKKRKDVKVVGEDLHPIGRVKDFAPYIAKIKASGADTVITGNWGNDLSLLVKAAKDAGLNARFFTYYAGVRSGRRPTSQVPLQPREHRHDAGAAEGIPQPYVSSTPTSCQMKRP